MTTGKGLRSKRDPQLPGFIRSSPKAGEQAQICVRIPQALRNSFEQAQLLLREHGMDMQLAEVVRLAIQDACRLVAERYGDADPVASNDLGEAHTGDKLEVKDSSRHAVEESGSSSVFDGQSETLEDPPLTGSRATAKESSGVVFAGEGGRNGAR